MTLEPADKTAIVPDVASGTADPVSELDSESLPLPEPPVETWSRSAESHLDRQMWGKAGYIS